jgi:hypothetical protein
MRPIVDVGVDQTIPFTPISIFTKDTPYTKTLLTEKIFSPVESYKYLASICVKQSLFLFLNLFT